MKAVLSTLLLFFLLSPYSSASEGPNSWTLNLSGAGPIWSILVNPTNQLIMYAGSNTMGMYKSTDGGDGWFPINTGLANQTIQAACICSILPNVIYCGTGPAGSGPAGVYKTTNAGATWSFMPTTGISENSISIQAMAVSPLNPNIIYIAVWDANIGNAVNGLYKSTNGGTNWFSITSGIGVIKNFLCLAINPLNPNIVYAGTSTSSAYPTEQARIFRTNNGGTNWFNASNGLPPTQGQSTHDPIRCLSIQPVDTSRLIAGLLVSETTYGGVYLTTNGGASWIRTWSGLPIVAGYYMRSILIRPGSTSEFYVGFGNSSNSGIGVYRTVNSGLSWVNFNGGALSGSITIRALNFKATGDSTLFAGGAHPTMGSGQGVFAYSFLAVGIKNVSNIVPDKNTLEQNYPNPFNPGTKFKIQISKLSKVKIIIYDVLGREVATLVNEELKPGMYEYEWDGTTYPGGVYFYKLIANDFTETRKMVLLK